MPSRLAPPDRLGLDQGVTRVLSHEEMQRLDAAMAIAASPVTRLAKPKGTKKPKGKPKPRPTATPKGKPIATPKSKKSKR
ncbi:MAG: hypothetical protein ABI665_04135 [Vicinamibacterales bacterium]